MDTHVRVLAILYLVFAGLSVLIGLAIFLFTGAATYLLGSAAQPDTQVVLPLIRLGGAAVALFFVFWAVPGVVVGVGLLRRGPWARVFGLVISALSLVHVPFGTALGAYGLWVLLHHDTERLFAEGDRR